MATATAERNRTISSPSAIPKETLETGEDGYPVKMWNVNGEPVAFSLRPFTDEERKSKRYWNPQGPMAPMPWKAQERNEQGYQVTIQRECWVDGSFMPRNAWEEYMTVDYLKRWVEGGSNAENWVGYDHPDNKTLAPGQQPYHWICGTCGWAVGVYSCLDQHQLSKQHSGIRKNK